MHWEKLSIEELKRLLNKETRNFIDALDKNKDVEELKEIRKKIKDIIELLEKSKRE